jgi:hypothetical protein
MHKLLLLLPMGIFSTFAVAQYQPLDVKTGQWQTTVLVNRSGSLAMPSDYMAKLTPEQRARVESAMKQASKPKTTARVNQDCLTQDELKRGTPFKPDDHRCTQKLLNMSSSRLNVEQDCIEDSMTMKTTMSLEAMSPELVKGAGTVTVTSEGHTLTSNITFTSEWTSPTCDTSSKAKLGEFLPGLKSKISAPEAEKDQPPEPK